jgi:hypothetical protein
VRAAGAGYAAGVNPFAVISLLIGLVLLVAGVLIALGRGPVAERLERPRGDDDVAGHLADTPGERRGLGALVAASGLVLLLLSLAA